jgi:hypothetical protein
MMKAIFITATLASSTAAASEELSATPGIDRLQAETALDLKVGPYTQPTNTTFFEWKLDEPFWIALGSIVLSTSVVLLAVHASKNGHPVSLDGDGSTIGGPNGA